MLLDEQSSSEPCVSCGNRVKYHVTIDSTIVYHCAIRKVPNPFTGCLYHLPRVKYESKTITITPRNQE